MQMIADAVGRCRQVLEGLVKKGADTEMNPESFRCAIGTIKDAVNELGRKALEAVIANAESTEDVLEREGKRHRFKQVTPKIWVTPFGKLCVNRRYYQQDSGGNGFAAIDLRCGMVDRFMTADVEEMAAFTAAMLTPSEVECLLDMALPDGPSAKAISRVIQEVGTFFENDAEAVEEHITDAAPLSDDGDVLAVSWDGVMVATRDKSGPTVWREAGVGTVSIYRSPSDDSPEPERIDARYFGRMPESGMDTLIAQIEHQVSLVQDSREFRQVAVLCDGKDTIWDTAEQSEVLAGAIHILDFYHASSYVSGVANAIYGEGTSRAKSWHQRWRDKLQLDDHAVPKLIRAIKRAMATIGKGTQRHDVLRRAVNFLGRNAERMRYTEFIRLGLPIGSGPVESACKNIVNARLKRSGMRWSIEGGQNVLNLRVHLKSDRWAPAWETYLNRAA